ncbi:MAG: hypothetical protein IPN17_26725 [Deltaproteobacteria bacterium]|nr:hypothetical protein [Deltaproteobacteria bacterium]
MMGTTPITYERNRTHRVVIMMGGSSGATADAFFDFVPNGEPLTERRDIIETASCQSCHGANEFRGHGGDRMQIQTCASCHVPGLVDPHGGENLDLAPMVHRIHMGSELPSVRGPDGVTYDNPATPANEAADNRSYRIWGNGNTLHTYDHVGFPAVIANCTKCHQGTGAQVDNWLRRPTRAACGSCHDNVNFATGQNHPFGAVQTNDANCFMCHDVSGGATSIRAAPRCWTDQGPAQPPGVHRAAHGLAPRERHALRRRREPGGHPRAERPRDRHAARPHHGHRGRDRRVVPRAARRLRPSRRRLPHGLALRARPPRQPRAGAHHRGPRAGLQHRRRPVGPQRHHREPRRALRPGAGHPRARPQRRRQHPRAGTVTGARVERGPSRTAPRRPWTRS